MPKAKGQILLLKVSITTLSQNIWHMKSVNISDSKLSTARGQYYYIESLYDVSTHHWGQGSTARGQF